MTLKARSHNASYIQLLSNSMMHELSCWFLHIASDRVKRPLYRAIVKTIVDIRAWLSKHSLSIFLIGSKGLFIWRRAGPLCRDLAFTKIPQHYLCFILCLYESRASPVRRDPAFATRDLG